MPNGTLTSIIQASGVKPGSKWVQELQDITDALELRILHELRDVTGSNSLVATAHPDITQLAGQTFWFIAPATNTGAMKMKIGAHQALDLRTRSGAVVQGGQCVAGYAYIVQHIDDQQDPHYRFLTSLAVATAPITRIYDAAGTYSWSKPSGLAYVDVEVIGGGAGGWSVSVSSTEYARVDGGSGAFARGIIQASQLAATETVTVGAGGAEGHDGGDSSFGTHVVAGGGISRVDGQYAIATAGDILLPGTPAVRLIPGDRGLPPAPPYSAPQTPAGNGGGPGAPGAGREAAGGGYAGRDGIVIVREYY